MALPLSTARSTMYGKKKKPAKGAAKKGNPFAKKSTKGKAPAKGAKGAKKPAGAGTKKVPAFLKKKSKK